MDEPDERAYRDGFNKIRHRMPSDQELRDMSYSDLAVLLSSHVKDSPAHSVIAREMRRKAAIEDAALARPRPSFWVHPVTRTVLYIVGVVVAAGILVFFGLK